MHVKLIFYWLSDILFNHSLINPWILRQSSSSSTLKKVDVKSDLHYNIRVLLVTFACESCCSRCLRDVENRMRPSSVNIDRGYDMIIRRFILKCYDIFRVVHVLKLSWDHLDDAIHIVTKL